MKQLAVFLVLLIASQSFGLPLVVSKFGVHKLGKPDIDFCKTCIDFAGQFINQLLNIILNAGVVGTCGELCELLEEKTGSKFAGLACNLLCDYVGIKEFIKLIEEADLDPIYYCELLKTCKVKDDGDATINSLTVVPNKVPRGSTFSINFIFTTQNGTGTGEIDIVINTQDGVPLGNSELIEPLQPGSYNSTVSVDAKPDPNCDPTQDICENWLPGKYSVVISICNGECGSKHPHSQVYDTKQAPFDVVAGRK